MICKTCGYESRKNFYICPFCGGDKVVTQNVDQEANQNKYYQNNLSSQYQTPFTSPNPRSNIQNEQNIEYNNYNSDPALNYQDVPQTINEPSKPARPVYDPAEVAPFLRSDFGASFSATENEIRLSRYLDGGDFIFWPKMFSTVIGILIVVGAFYGIHLKPTIMDSTLGIFGFILVLIFGFLFTQFGKFATIIVNSNGITTKTLLGKFFIPREKVDYCEYQSVTRWKMVSTRRRRNLIGYGRRRRSEASLEPIAYLDVFIKTKEKSKWKIDKIDTGLCYSYHEPVEYLKDEFNRILDVQEKFY